MQAYYPCSVIFVYIHTVTKSKIETKDMMKPQILSEINKLMQPALLTKIFFLIYGWAALGSSIMFSHVLTTSAASAGIRMGQRISEFSFGGVPKLLRPNVSASICP